MLHLRVVSPEGTLVDEPVHSVTLPGLAGDFTVLAEHHDTVAQLRDGIAGYTAKGGKHYLSILGGTATVRGEAIEVFSPICEHAKDLDAQRAHEARRRAEERLAEKQEGLDVARAQAALRRALIRLEVVKLLRGK
jgi:F-type H+-transporting ATPase subunit epsilon